MSDSDDQRKKELAARNKSSRRKLELHKGEKDKSKSNGHKTPKK